MTTDTTHPQTHTAQDSGLRAYRQGLRTPTVRTWLAAVLCQRLPIAMAPLALVYIGKAAVLRSNAQTASDAAFDDLRDQIAYVELASVEIL